MTTSLPAPHYGRLSDLALAELWVESLHSEGELHFTAVADKRNGEYFVYLPEKEKDGRTRCKIKYILETDIEARILRFLMGLADAGASVKITTAKIHAVRNLGGLLMVQEGRNK